MRRLLTVTSWTTGIGQGSHLRPIQPMQPRLHTLRADGGKKIEHENFRLAHITKTIRQSILAAQQTRAPRAVLVKLPPPKAHLVRLPECKVGERRPVMMPYNVEVLATYKGQLAAEWMLPSSGNAQGDTWVVGDTPWVWIWAPGAVQADWIDP
jgi:hypothetical protein